MSSGTEIARQSGGRFSPGSSGNPSGRPRYGADAMEALARARELAPEAVEKLWQLACDDSVPPRVRKDALVAILDRGLGRPRQTPTRLEEIIETLSEAELLELAQRALIPTLAPVPMIEEAQ